MRGSAKIHGSKKGEHALNFGIDFTFKFEFWRKTVKSSVGFPQKGPSVTARFSLVMVNEKSIGNLVQTKHFS